MMFKRSSTPSRTENFIASTLRPIIGKWRDSRRVRGVNRDISEIIPHLAQERIAPGSWVVDLGANRGDFSVWCLEKGMNVVALEPHPDAFTYFVNRTKEWKNIIRLQAAASSIDKKSSILVHPCAVQDQLGFSIRSTIKNEKQGFVPYAICLEMKLENILESLDEVKILKIDIEGSELEVWPIIMVHKSRIDYLLMEIHDEINPNLRKEVNEFIETHQLVGRWTADWV